MCAGGPRGAATCRACPADRGKRHRATLVEVLFVQWNGQVRMGGIELFVEVRELASGVLEEEAPTDGERGAKQIHRQQGKEDENGVPIGVKENGLVAGHELQLVEQPKSVAQEDDDRE